MLFQMENKFSFMSQPFQENVNIPSKKTVNHFQGIKSTFSVWMVLLPPKKRPFLLKF